MKQHISELLDRLEPHELSALLSDTDVKASDPKLTKRILLKTRKHLPQKTKPRAKGRRAAVAVALSLLCLLFAVGMGVFAAEQKEYREAVSFFEAHDLPYESLTRSEIKRIFRDITEERFVYDKTADVIGQGIIKNSVDGYEIVPETPSPEEIKALWQKLNAALKNPTVPEGIRYSYRNEYVGSKPDGTGITLFDKAYLEIYDGETLLSSTPITDFPIDGFVTISDGVLVYGSTYRNSSLSSTHAYVAKITNDGKCRWQRKLSGEYKNEIIVAAMEEKSGNYAIFFRGNFVNLGFVRLGRSGKELTHEVTEIGSYGVSRAKETENGFLLQLWSYTADEYAKILKVLPDGTVSESYSYTHDTEQYFITDLIEYRGKIYLSAYATPKDSSPMHDYVFQNPTWDTSEGGSLKSEALNEIARDCHTAYLLVCNEKNGSVEEFYSVKASHEGFLSIDADGRLVWQVGQILSVYYSPMTSSFTFGISSRIIAYTFNENGTLLEEKKTNSIISFRR